MGFLKLKFFIVFVFCIIKLYVRGLNYNNINLNVKNIVNLYIMFIFLCLFIINFF